MQTPANKSVGTVATGDDRVVAIEFDTYLNDGFDASGSHMGIDMNSIISGAYTNATVPGRNLTSGLPVTCNITYSNNTKILVVLLQVGCGHRILRCHWRGDRATANSFLVI
ncbi:Lectin-domain containing receptor kinase A4.2 [Hordeum vulgare]|nr:Lectin-domain containing receptor kinase A4.2 [Hordeum vulgare]